MLWVLPLVLIWLRCKGAWRAPVPPAASSGPFIAADTPAVSTDPVAENWWRLYDDPVLDGLVEDALTANTDLRVAIANIARARAGLKRSEEHTSELQSLMR